MDKLKQVVPKEDQETCITLDYGNELVILFTNVATMMNRLEKEGFKYYSEQTYKGEVMARQYKLAIEDRAVFLKVKLHR